MTHPSDGSEKGLVEPTAGIDRAWAKAYPKAMKAYQNSGIAHWSSPDAHKQCGYWRVEYAQLERELTALRLANAAGDVVEPKIFSVTDSMNGPIIEEDADGDWVRVDDARAILASNAALRVAADSYHTGMVNTGRELTAEIALREKAEKFIQEAFIAHPNLDLDVENAKAAACKQLIAQGGEK